MGNGAIVKIVPTFLLVLMICPLAANFLTTNYPFIKDASITPIAVNGNTVTVSITFNIYFTHQAWTTFRYADGSFPYMNAWWQGQVGHTFTYMGHSAKLLSLHWTLLHHYSDHDRLNAIVKMQILQ